jgi:hypothetical protein
MNVEAVQASMQRNASAVKEEGILVHPRIPFEATKKEAQKPKTVAQSALSPAPLRKIIDRRPRASYP